MEDVRADRAILAKLKRLDKRLNCKFNGTHFVITYDRGYGAPVNVYSIHDNGRFRQPNQTDIDHVAGGDLERESGRDRTARAAKYAHDYEDKQKKDARDNIRDMTKDSKVQLKRAYDRVAKGNPPKRRGMPLG